MNHSFVLLIAFVGLSVVSGQVSIKQSEFEKGVTSNGFSKPTSAQYKGYQNSLKAGGITTKIEAAMYLAQLLHESGGLKKKREDGCSGPNGCPNKYPASGEWLDECKGSSRPSGVSYYGRGYLQLTWCSNYVQASKALGKGTQLKTNPDSVASSEDLSWGVSAWFWNANVHKALGGTDQFGRTTKSINGQSQECQGNGSNADKSKQRFKYYTKVFAAYSISGTPNEAGCNY